MNKWLQNIKQAWKIVSHQGIPNNQPIGSDEFRIILVNRLSLAGSIISLFYVFHYFSFPSEFLYLIEGSLVFFYLFCIALNKLKKYRTAKYLIIILALVNVIVNASSLGREGGDHLIFIAIFFSIPLIHKTEDLSDIFICGLLSVCAYFLLEISDYSLLPTVIIDKNDLAEDYRMNMLITFVLSVIINYFYFQVKALQHRHLTDAEKKLSGIFEQAYDAIFLIQNRKFEIINCSNKALQIFKFDSKADIVGKNLKFLFKDDEFFKSVFNSETINAQSLTIDKEIECLDANGEKFWGNVAISTLDISNEDLIQVRITDITLRKQLESELREAKSEAEKASQYKGAFLANMSHEIRTPIHAILSITRLLEKENLTEEQLNHLDVMKVSGENLLYLINDILDVSKIEAGKITLENIELNLHDTLESIYKSFHYHAQEKKINLRLDYDKALTSYFIGDPVRLNQVITNLVSNALKFTEKGEVSISAKLLEENYDSATIRFAVKDTGIGISEDKIPEIFKGYTQASLDTTRKFGGTGLGLTIVKNLVELFGGYLTIASKPNEGSEFSFSIKLEKDKTASQKNKKKVFANPASQKDLTGINILLVEDNEINQLVASKFIRDWNVNLDIADNGKIATEMLKLKKNYHVILMDLQMPVMDGYEATKVINEMDFSPGVKPAVIALTASALFEIKDKVKNSGFDDFLVKPFHSEALFEKIKANISSEFVDTDISKKVTKNESMGIKNSIDWEKVKMLFEGEEAQMENFYNKCLEEMEHFKSSYIKSLEERNLTQVKSISHKVNSFLVFLSADFLLAEINISKNLLESGNYTNTEIETCINNVKEKTNLFLQLVQEKATDTSQQSV